MPAPWTNEPPAAGPTVAPGRLLDLTRNAHVRSSGRRRGSDEPSPRVGDSSVNKTFAATLIGGKAICRRRRMRYRLVRRVDEGQSAMEHAGRGGESCT
jgi:hypothetical protein